MVSRIHTLAHWWITRPWNSWLDSTNKLTQNLVAVGGGLAAFRKFGISAEPSITGSPFQSRGRKYLIITTAIKNTGAVKLDILQRGTGMSISLLEDAAVDDTSFVAWVNLAVLPIFELQQWINPSKSIQEVTVVRVPPDRVAVKLSVRVITKYSRLNMEWNSTSVVELPDMPSLPAAQV